METLFAVGDVVIWDGLNSQSDKSIHPRNRWGEGPFRVREVIDIPPGQLACGHFIEDPEHTFCVDLDSDERFDEQSARDAVGHSQVLVLEDMEGTLIRSELSGNRKVEFSGSWFAQKVN